MAVSRAGFGGFVSSDHVGTTPAASGRIFISYRREDAALSKWTTELGEREGEAGIAVSFLVSYMYVQPSRPRVSAPR